MATIVRSPKDASSKAGGNKHKVVISGDDILIEYCQRLKIALRKLSESVLRPSQHTQLIRFITHYVWRNQDKVDVMATRSKGGVPTTHKNAASQRPTVGLDKRISNRIAEMKDRRKRLIKI